MLKRRMVLQVVALSIIVFFIVFTKLSKDTENMEGMVLISLIASILALTFYWLAIRDLEIKKKDDQYPSFLSVVMDAKISKYSLIGMVYTVISLCLVLSGGVVKEENKVIYDNLILSG
jgi:hypothetical protein